MSSGPAPGDIVEVRILGLPLAEYQLAAQHHDELLREFSHLDPESDDVPARLLALRAGLEARFGPSLAAPRNDIAQAIERGDPFIDVVYQLPLAAGPATTQLGELLDEVDEFCARGEHLLTLATPERARRYRRWFLGEFTRQCSGESPVAWSDYLAGCGALSPN